MEAVDQDRADIARLLLQYKADPTQKDNIGNSAISRLEAMIEKNAENFDIRTPYKTLLEQFQQAARQFQKQRNE